MISNKDEENVYTYGVTWCSSSHPTWAPARLFKPRQNQKQDPHSCINPRMGRRSERRARGCMSSPVTLRPLNRFLSYLILGQFIGYVAITIVITFPLRSWTFEK